jgi:hypothetical protein
LVATAFVPLHVSISLSKSGSVTGHMCRMPDWLSDVLTHTADHNINRIDEPLP